MNNPIQITVALYKFIKNEIKCVRFMRQKKMKFVNWNYFVHMIYDLYEECFLGIDSTNKHDVITANKKRKRHPFPVNKYKIMLYGVENNNTTFHVKVKGWDVLVNPNDGKIEQVVTEGKNRKYYEYIQDNISEWLDEYDPRYKETNRERIIFLLDAID